MGASALEVDTWVLSHTSWSLQSQNVLVDPRFLQTYRGEHGSGPTPHRMSRGGETGQCPPACPRPSAEPTTQETWTLVVAVPLMCPSGTPAQPWASSHDTPGWAQRPVDVTQNVCGSHRLLDSPPSVPPPQRPDTSNSNPPGSTDGEYPANAQPSPVSCKGLG